MIRITIELLPFGFEENKRHLGTITIANDASDTLTSGNYKAKLSQSGESARPWKETYIKDFPRKQRNAYDLLYRVLKQVVGERNENDTKRI
jgi:hypothetical protein